jgi:peptide/nickel transport system permease protein
MNVSAASTVQSPTQWRSQAEQVIAPTRLVSQRRMMWERFRRHRLAMVSGVIVVCLYIVALAPEFFAYALPEASQADRALIAPQRIRLFHDGTFVGPFVYALEGKRDPQTFQKVYAPNPDKLIPVRFFAQGYPYKLLNLIPMDRHLIGVEGADARQSLALLGTDLQGRDLWSRLMYATRISLTIGLASVLLSLAIGVVLGGVSGYFGGWIDLFVQRVIEIVRSIPTIPLWMGLAAALPQEWSIVKVYLAMTIIISLIGWTDLARVIRGRFLSIRNEDFVLAARVCGCDTNRIIVRHMMPTLVSHIIAVTTLAIPAMIISETTLSFLGLGLRPPAVSWGVLLQAAQNVQAIALTPWLLFPAVMVIVTVIAFNFLGDGMRDAADPFTRR